MAKRRVVRIDLERCDGCGQCVPSCAEGAIKIVDGKARLVADALCDGLGACLGECPKGAISIEEREADPFDEQAVAVHGAPPAGRGGSGPGAAKGKEAPPFVGDPSPRDEPAPMAPSSWGCPGAAARSLQPRAPGPDAEGSSPSAPPRSPGAPEPSALVNWPIQLKLVSPLAPDFRDADLLLAADCAPFALAGFHGRLLAGKVLLIACPKLDADALVYVEKLAQIVRGGPARSLSVVRMEVPCCSGLTRLAQLAVEKAGSPIPVEEIVVGLRGEILQTRPVGGREPASP